MFADRENYLWTGWPTLRTIKSSAAYQRCRMSAATSAPTTSPHGSPGRESVTAFDVAGPRRPIRSLAGVLLL